VSPAQCHISLAPDFANLSVLESFVGSCSFLEKEERLRILLIATEYFQNIVAYNRNPVRSDVDLRIVKDGTVSLIISYATRNFSELQRAAGTASPHYDSETLRYRGLGLRMCKNLSSSIQYKKGLFKSSVIIIL
jgi:anti-sigma regulatory factor (Ser/Thr protein kinase)